MILINIAFYAIAISWNLISGVLSNQHNFNSLSIWAPMISLTRKEMVNKIKKYKWNYYRVFIKQLSHLIKLLLYCYVLLSKSRNSISEIIMHKYKIFVWSAYSWLWAHHSSSSPHLDYLSTQENRNYHMTVQVWRMKKASIYILILWKIIDTDPGKLLPSKSLTEAH